jgi:hypothetical protein
VDLKRSQQAALELRRVLKRILLQRKKVDFEDALKLTGRSGGGAWGFSRPLGKIEVTVWIPLSQKQRDLYEAYLHGSEMASVMQKSIYPIGVINYLKTLSR